MVERTLPGSPSGSSKSPRKNSCRMKSDLSRVASTNWQDRAPSAQPAIPEELQTTYQRLQWNTYLLFDEARSSLAAHAISIFILITIVMSIIAFTLKTMPELAHVPENVWLAIDAVASVIFTIEYAFRLWACVAVIDPPREQGRKRRLLRTKRLRFIFNLLNVFDLLAILPFYLDLAVRDLVPGSTTGFLKVLRAMRLIRLFRIFKLGRYSQGMKLMVQALVNSAQALWVLFFFIVLGVILFSSAVYYMERLGCPIWSKEEERDEDEQNRVLRYEEECEASNTGYSDSGDLCCIVSTGAPQEFPSIVAAFWWSIVTMTTVGYGDKVPRTPQGMLVGALCMLLGILLIALPVAIVGSKFQEVYQAMETESQDHQLDLQDCSYVFDDADPDQPLEPHESLAELVKEVDLTNVHPMMQRQVHQLIPLVDNASQLQKRLSTLHRQEEKMHEALQDEFEEFIEKMKQRSSSGTNQQEN